MLKTVGILLVILGASGTGFSMALAVQRQVAVARQLIGALEQMKNEMSYRKTPLPELMRLLAVSATGPVAGFFSQVADRLSLRQESSVAVIFKKVLADTPPAALSPGVRGILQQLGSGLGQFDVEGQLRSIDLALTRLRSLLDQAEQEQRQRCKSYCALGICAGLAVAIMVL